MQNRNGSPSPVSASQRRAAASAAPLILRIIISWPFLFVNENVAGLPPVFRFRQKKQAFGAWETGLERGHLSCGFLRWKDGKNF